MALVINCEFMWRISGVGSVGGERHVEEETDLCQPFLTGSAGRAKEKRCDWCRREDSRKVVIGTVGQEL